MQISKIEALPKEAPRKKRVAAYARVSDGKDAMLHSLAAQISYYSDLIQNNPKWEFVSVFADEALTGTKDTRPEFQKMMAECRAGHIDMVITKAISRLARNTVTILESVRTLKELNIDVYFEEQNIHSLSGDGELMLTILSSYAQEESRSCSENCRWHIRKQFVEGRPTGGNMLGYKQVNGVFTIIPEEAELVRQIYDDYLSGMGFTAIEKKLRSQGVKFTKSAISKLLRNEKYQGDMLLQKTFTLDHISKKKMVNKGQMPQYFVQDSHEPIISREIFAKVQAEMKRRAEHFNAKPEPPKTYPFTGMIRCGICGANYRRKITAAGSKYEKPVWICGTFNTYGKAECDSQQIPEAILKAKIAEVLRRDDFDGSIMKMMVSEIRVPDHNQLTFIFVGGSEYSIDWGNPSRSKSWTPEMREAAWQRQLDKNNSKGDKYGEQK